MFYTSTARCFLAFNFCVAATAVCAEDPALQSHAQKLEAELKVLQAQVKTLEAKTEALAEQQDVPDASGARLQTPNGAQLWGYGEVNYTRPRDDSSAAQMDLRRAIFGIGYRFDEHTRLVTEYEIEHAIVSADDHGELEVEQFYVDHQLSKAVHLKAGLFLVPAGLLNESHEPVNYYGVQRNQVETAIIPSTWREGGLAVFGTTDAGWAWDLGITTTVNLNGWDATSDEGRESPLGSIHQELQLASAEDLGAYGALNYRGVPGLTLGGSVFTSKVGQGEDTLPYVDDVTLLLWDLHARWTPNNWDLSAVYARGTFSNTQDINTAFAGKTTPVPAAFYGGYLQAAYKIWQHGSYALSPFVRAEAVNTASAYASMPLGLTQDAAKTDTITTLGASFFLNPKVVFKIDYQTFAEDESRDGLNLGMGVAF